MYFITVVTFGKRAGVLRQMEYADFFDNLINYLSPRYSLISLTLIHPFYQVFFFLA
jgi:hypothetical protein